MPVGRSRVISGLDEIQLADIVEYIAAEDPELFGRAIEFLTELSGQKADDG